MIHNRPVLKSRRKELRNNSTSAEKLLWGMLQHSNLGGYKFRRQHSVGAYILDFYCPSEKLAVELDGAIQYEVTVTDPKTFSRPWTISMPLYRHKDMDRLLEYHCQAELEEANGAFERDPRTWYPGR